MTKFPHVDHLLGADYQGKTRFRFSINDDYIIKCFEPDTGRLHERIEASVKVVEAGYPLGFIVAPVYIHDGWKEGYYEMFEKLEASLPAFARKDLTFEMIQHRFTKPAKRVIQENYSMIKLELDESKRKTKWGRDDIYKYVYQDEEQKDIKETIGGYIHHFFPEAKIDYFT